MPILPENIPVTRAASNKLDIWVYADPQVGKTQFASTFPNAVVITTDGNIKHIDTPAVQLQSKMVVNLAGTNIEITGWEYLTQYLLPDLKADTSYQTVILDLVEDMYELCRSHWNAKFGVKHESEIEWSRGYEIIRSDFYNFIKDVKALPKHMILLSHTKDNKNVKGENEVRPNITKKVENKLHGYVDLVSYMYKTTNADGSIERALLLDSIQPVSANRWGITQPAAVFATYDALIAILQTIQK